MSGSVNWLKRRWAAHVERVRLRRWESVSYESDNEGMELPTDDNELSTPEATGGAGLSEGEYRRATAGPRMSTRFPPTTHPSNPGSSGD